MAGPASACRGRDPRQDHDDRPADERAAGGGCGSDVRRGGRAHRHRPQRRCRHRRPVRRRGRRVRRRLPRLPPHAAIVTNVEADHLDNWGTEEAYHAAFDEFADTIDRDGFLVCCVDDPGARTLAATARGSGLEVITVGEAADCDVRIVDLALDGSTSTSRIVRDGVDLGELRLRIPGRHYVLDAAAALAMGLRLGFAFDDLTDGLAAFTGTGRRMELKGEAAGVRVYDSYAHHHVEIAGDLQAARVGRRRRPARRRLPAPPRLPHPRPSARRWARRWVPPTRSSCSTSTSPGRTPTRPSPDAWSPTPYPCRPSRSSSRPTSTPSPPSSSAVRAPAT